MPCTGGFYCDGEGLPNPTDECNAGYYCVYGVDRAMPTGENHTLINGSCTMPGGETGVGGVCPAGFYCPTGSTLPIPCAAGSFANVTGLASCINCPAGFYCLYESETYLDSPCPSGHYCPEGTTNPYQYPCPAKTYFNLTQARDVSDCLPCPGGEYCQTDGIGTPTGLCQQGWYCTSNSSSATPSPPEGGECHAGFYCPAKSSGPLQCLPGMYCEIDGLDYPTGNCSAGYYCTLQSNTSTPSDDITGNICPVGHYCPEASSVEMPCPMGYYLDVEQQDELSDCKLCPLGQYCPGSGLSTPQGNCGAGYYCPGGQNSSTPVDYPCPLGHYCIEGSDSPAQCSNGTYQPLQMQSSCLTCPSGYFCDNTMDIVILDNSTTICPMGSYCPDGTRFSNEFLCPIGTFNNRTGLQAETDCTPCLGGYYCPLPGMVTPVDLCDAGYFCRQYANISTPDQGIDANICPVGYYCTEGTSNPYPCPSGTFSNQTGLQMETDCTACTPGFYCQSPAVVEETDPCDEGYFCVLGSNNSQPEICPVGHFCPTGSSNPTPCPRGTYTNTPGLANETQCTSCDPGKYCNDTGLSSTVGDCDPGFYCPGGDDVPNPVATPCPIGLHCPMGHSLPVPCPAGSYANFSQAEYCLTCPEGYYCVPEEVIEGNSSSGHRLCPRGFYCGAGTGLNWTACPVGTFSNILGLQDISQCQYCLGGQYCDLTNLTQPSGYCDPGYYCTLGVDVTDPAGSHTGDGGICPPGTYCDGGNTIPQPCDVGTYQDQSGQSSCSPCPAGYFCVANSTTYLSQICPSGHYCLEGTQYDVQYPCPAGSFNNLTGQHNITGCEPCTPGQYCGSTGLSNPTGDCDSGWYCTLGSTLLTPTAPEGGKCLAGTYCPQGSPAPIGCTPGQYCDSVTMPMPAGDCLAGYYCDSNSTTSMPSGIGGDQCPSGHYCVAGSSTYTPCDPGYYQPSVGGQNISWCIMCTAGKFCNSSGLSTPDGDCDAGYYCPEGQTVRNPSPYECQPGYFCTAGSSVQTICPSGQYQDLARQSNCKDCPPGYFCDNSFGPITTPASYPCPEGYYCSLGTRFATEHPCPAGTFNNVTGLQADTDCFDCLGGFYCPGATIYPNLSCSASYYCRYGASAATPSQGYQADICPIGHYCPEMTAEPIDCLIGTFSNVTGLRNSSDCTICKPGSYCDSPGMTEPADLCSPGFYCIEGSITSSPDICPEGRYCPEGTHTPIRCPTGTFSNATQLTAEENCTICTAGYYCQTTGITIEQGPCQQGYYCPTGSTIPNAVICPIGLHCPEGSDEPRSCLPGYFTNTTGMWECDICPDGFYCLPSNVTAGDPTSGYFDCPAGYYCPNGTGLDWQACPKGTYSPHTNLYKVTQCTDCTGGYYCSVDGDTAVTGQCSEGYYCQSGVDRSNPDNSATNSSYPPSCPLIGGHTGYGDVCPKGFRCPVGSELPIGCDAGTYQDQEGQGTCKDCPAGFYCPSNSTDYLDKPCPRGYYCPLNTEYSIQYPCSAGTFNPATRQTNVTACLPCTAGTYCQTDGLYEPTGNCSGGWFCYAGSTDTMPASNPEMGDKCKVGQYCPLGSVNYTLCDGGMYCGSERLSEPLGNCSQSYYCSLGASQPTPRAGDTGGPCPKGHYCPEGSTYGNPCPIGYYLDTERNYALSACKECTPGKFCDRAGLEVVAGDCDPGYYCPAMSTSATPSNNSCPEGHFCVEGLEAPETCPSGYYQKLPGQSSCDLCPAGFYCNATFGPVVTYDPYVCPEGYYCPNGTEHAQQYPCHINTFNNRTGLVASLECTACVGGMACDQEGLSYPIRPCSAGYYCRNSAGSTTPNQAPDAAECPAGSYCQEQTAEPVPCPQGTYSPSPLLTQESECLNCTLGFFCNQTGLIAVMGPCEERYYCPERSSQPSAVVCPEGSYCPVQSATPTGCPNGTFSNQTGLASASECTQCMPGYYCNGLGLTETTGPCKEGYYCPLGSSIDTQVICPSAKYCPTGSASPQDCPAGFYVDYDGALDCQVCPEGYYCIPSLTIAGDPASAKHLCPEGFFCPNGTGHDWQACPAGTFSSVTGLRTADECTPCLAGEYCQGVNSTNPTGPCAPGYYCVSGVDKANPVMLNDSQCPADTVHPIIGHICPVSHYCPGGTDFPVGCPAGSFQDLTNQANCKNCPVGYFCPANTSDYSTNICPKGHYCQVNTTDQYEFPCPAGTFNPATQQDSVADCLPCSPGKYCQGVGNEEPTGNCSAGWYCINGSSNAQPSTNGGVCQPGYFCPEGSHAMQECTPGSYCQTTELEAPTDLCDAGYYCPLGSDSQTEVVCPIGHYCVQGSEVPEPCRNGTYAPTPNLASEGECTPCDGGFYCNGTGLHAVSGECDRGYYCPPGQSVPTPYDYLCLAGHYCLANSATPSRCPSGEYQNEVGQWTCKDCPQGYYCDNSLTAVSNLSSFACPQGYYCPPKTEYFNQYPCPSGTFNNKTHRTEVADCQNCLPGFFCQSTGLPEPEGLCYAGYYCVGNNTSPIPSETLCPVGNYCPEGSYQPIPCPQGTLASSPGNDNVTDCEPCDPGRYCTPNSSMNGISLPCDAGYICLTGSSYANPTDNVMGYICPAGHYCPSGAVVKTPCDKGKYAPSTGLGTCLTCLAGKTCPDQGMNSTLPCPDGNYCESGTDNDGTPCPLGTYNPHTGLSQSSECSPCSAGMFCNVTGLNTPAGLCQAGFLCVANAISAAPNDGTNKPCSAGHYCEEGTLSATPCPRGTIRDAEGGQSLSDCWPCDPGYYCNDTGSLQPAGVCEERYYCPDFAAIETAAPFNYACPAGFYCPENSGIPIGCPPGTYQPNGGEISCLECPSGYYCVQNTSIPDPCPSYSYCPNGTSDPILCPNGTYTDALTTGLEDAYDCWSCIAGKYCNGGQIAGDCAAGYLCKYGNYLPNPSNGTGDNGLCPYGFYCPAGTTTPVTCPPLSFIDKIGAGDISECQPCPGGRICPENSTVSIACYPGYYCKVSQAIEPCPITTYNELEEANDESWCLPCPPGYVCDEVGTYNYSTKPCPIGSYCINATAVAEPCPKGTYRGEVGGASLSDCELCPAGFYCPNKNMTYPGIQCDQGMACPAGSHNQTICSAGYYCNMSMGQTPCPPGYYCPERSSFPILCPVGHYCEGIDDCNCNQTDAGAIEPRQCPLGYREYSGSLRRTFEETCEPCPPGYYGADPNRIECLPCRAGVVCKDGATTDDPVSNSSSQAFWLGFSTTNSYLCPPGYYCPEVSYEPTECPAGRYNPVEGAQSLSDCLLCAVDHYNPYLAQSGCFKCGGQASQSQRGATTCDCTGAGRDYQLSDKTCPCKAGYVQEGTSGDCSKQVYPRCGSGSTRTQDGRCFDDTQWETHCRQEVCEEYVGFDRNLGLCQCKTDDLEAICDTECRATQEWLVTFTCAAQPLVPYLTIRDSFNNTVLTVPYSNLLGITNARNAISPDQCQSRDNSVSFVRIVEMSSKGFLGIYNPDSSQLASLVQANAKGNFTGNITTDSYSINAQTSRRRLLATSNVTGSIFSGIQNPTTCLEYGEIMFFSVSNTYYPIYDVNNLYNTNSNFDYGGFRALIEAQAQTATSTTLFAYKFTDPGVYSFYLNTDINKKMYISVMPQNTQCTTSGPFFPTTPTYVVQNGISIDSDILKEPDWLIIFILLACALLAVIIMLIILLLFRKYGWAKASYLYPFYRIIANRYNFDDYSSKGSTVYPVRKYHRNMQALALGDGSNLDMRPPNAILDAGAVEVKNDDFWDYDRQTDLEGFRSQVVYDTLTKQSKVVTQAISQHKDNVKLMYQRIGDQAESLKGLWAAKMNLNGTSALATDEDLANYERKLESLEIELERRKDLGRQSETILNRQEKLMQEDAKDREEHQVNFQSCLREASRVLCQHADRLQKGEATVDGQFQHQMHDVVDQRVAILIEKMSDESKSECKRTGAWGVLGDGIGGQLIAPGSNAPLRRSDLFTNTNSIKATNLIAIDEKTGLVRPKAGVQMVQEDGLVVSVAKDSFIHPQTGHVLPIQGNVAFDPVTSRLVFVVDSATGEATKTDEPYIPYVPYPVNPQTSQRVNTKLKPMTNKSDFKWGLPMSDPSLGLHVPILAMTTGSVIPVGGVHTDPVTGLPVPIELGSMMADPNSGQAVPILAVTVDPETGMVVPIGGTKEGPNCHIPIIPGDDYVDSPSKKLVRIHGGHLDDANVNPSAGGYQALLDSTMLACEVRALDAVREYKEALYAASLQGGGVNVRHEEANLMAAMKELAKTREKMKALKMRTFHDIERRKQRATILATTGGSPGMYEFSKTGQLLPILVGTTMVDPSGSDQEVPVIGAERDVVTGKVIPLAGTMEDPEGEGLVPITIGRKAVDPVTGEMSPVVGIRRNPETKMAVPVTLSSSSHRKPRPPPGAVALLEEEVMARRGYWRRQRGREQDITVKQHQLTIHLIFDLDSVSSKSAEKSLGHIDSLVNQLNEAAKEESQRRGASTQEMATIIPLDVMAILTDGDKREAEDEMAHVATHVKFSEVVRKFFSKLELEEKHYKDRMDDLEGAMNPDAENTTIQRYRQGKLRLLAELRDQLKTRIESLDEDHSRLEYSRQHSELCVNEARVVLTRSALLAGDYDAQLCGVYGDAMDAAGQDSQLIPLIKQLIAMLEAGGPFYLSSELLNIINNRHEGGGSDVTNINILGAGVNVHNVHTFKDVDRNRNKTEAKLVKSSNTESPGSMGKAHTTNSPSIIVIGDMSKAKTTGTLTDEEYRDKKKYLFEKQAYEAAKLENDLHSQEVQTMNDTLKEFEAKKEHACLELSDEAKAKLAQAKTDAEKEKIIMEHAANMSNLSERLEGQKQQQLAELREKLLEKRRRQKKNLHNKHIAEAQGFGVPADEVPDIPAPSRDELDHQLKMLQQQQEKMQAELKLASTPDIESEQDDETEANFNQMVKNLGLNKQQQEEFKKSVQAHFNMGDVAKSMVKKLRDRSGRTNVRQPTEEELALLSEEERKALLEKLSLMNEADRNSEDVALMKALRAHEKEQMRKAQETALKALLQNASEKDRKEIMDRFYNEQHRMQSKLQDEREANLDKVKAKVAARKRMREQLTKDDAVGKELDHMTKTHAAKDDAEAANLITSINEKLHSEKLSSQQQAMIDEQLKKQEALDIEHSKKERQMERDLENELETQKKKVDEQINQQLKLVQDNQQAKFDREVLLQGKNMSEEEYKKLMEKFNQEQNAIQKSMDLEREKQKKALEQRMAERRDKQKDQLEQMNAFEMEEELIKQQQARDALSDKLAKEVEHSALKDSLKGKNGKEAENMIYSVLRQRHIKEAIHLEDQLAKEREAALKKVKADMEKQRSDEREILLAAFEQELVDLMGNAGSLTPEELTEKKEQLKQRQKKQLADFDELTERMVDRAVKNILPELDIAETTARLDLKDKQLQELAAAMRKYSPVDELRKKYEDDARKNREEMENFKKDVINKLQKELERQKEERRKREEQRKNQLVGQLQKLEKDLEDGHKREVERQKERTQEKERLRKQQMDERNRRQKEEIDKSNLSEEEKKKLMKEHNENMKTLEENLQDEQKRNENSLAAKLEARKQRRKAIAVAGMEKNSQLDLDEERRRELNMEASGDLLFGKEEAPRLGASMGSSVATSATGFESTGNTEQDWINLLMMSPLFKQINDLDDMLSKANTSEGPAGGKGVIHGADYSKSYIDVKDAQWECKGGLSPVDVNGITPSQFVIYRFGVFLIRLLHKAIDTPDVTLLLASNLPPNNYSNNAFRNSIFYEHKRNILFIRRERMDSIGEFVMVIVHSLAHIKAGDLTDDQNTQFMRVFYKALRVVCQDMFFSRSRNTSAANSLTGTDLMDNRRALESALTGIRNTDDRMNVIGELVDMKVDTPVNVGYSQQRMSQKLYGYETAASNARLRQQLNAQGGCSTSGDFVGSRMAELKGLRSPIKSPRSPTKHSRHSMISAPKDVLDSQIMDLRAKTDILNAELSQILKSESDIREGMSQLPETSEKTPSMREKLTQTLIRKEEVIRTVTLLEDEIHQKEKAVKKHK